MADERPPLPRPGAVRAASVLYLVAAAANAGVGGYDVVRIVQVPSTVVDRTPATVLATLAVVTAAYSAVLVLLVRRFLAGAPWARGALVMAGSLSLVAAAGPGAVVTLLLVAAAIVAARPSVTRWSRRMSGLRTE